jgi:hypothetical protein
MTAPLSIETIQAQLRRTKGMVAICARQLGVERSTIYRRIQASPTLQETIREEREMMTDTAEMKLYQSIMAGDLGAVKYYLSNQGKNRGYVERQEHTGPDGASLSFTINVGGTRDDDTDSE